MDGLFLLGRILFGGFFLYSGINQFVAYGMMVQYTTAKGVPAPDIAVVLSGLLLIAGATSVILGVLPHIGALCIVAFLVIVSPAMHNFWAVADPAQRAAEMVNFTKNMALAGGSLMMFGVPRPWPYSLERQRLIPA